MGDRWYMQQNAANGKGGKNGPKKPPRRLKKHVISEILALLNSPTKSLGLEKLTIANLDDLAKVIREEVDRVAEHSYNDGMEDTKRENIELGNRLYSTQLQLNKVNNENFRLTHE